MPTSPFATDITPDYEAFLKVVARQATPRRIHYVELFLDEEILQAIAQRFDLLSGLVPADPSFLLGRLVRVHRFLGYDYVPARLDQLDWTYRRQSVADSAALARAGGRSFVDLHTGPITNWEEFAAYPWPDPAKAATTSLEWFSRNLPDDMCILGRGVAHYAENLSWLMGYETLCYALYDQPDLVQAIYQKVLEIDREVVRLLLQFDRVKVIWASDDMGHRTGPLLSPEAMRQYVLPGHREIARLAHAAGRPYWLHTCGQVEPILADLLDDVKIDAKHSYEDAIEPVEHFYARCGGRVGVLGGIDMDYLCRQSEAAIRQRVRGVLSRCGRGLGYALGTGNSVANYIPIDHYLAMLDEGRRYQ